MLWVTLAEYRAKFQWTAVSTYRGLDFDNERYLEHIGFGQMMFGLVKFELSEDLNEPPVINLVKPPETEESELQESTPENSDTVFSSTTKSVEESKESELEHFTEVKSETDVGQKRHLYLTMS